MNKMTLQSAKNGFRVAIVGHRGIPNSYGGFETFAEKVAESLVGLGARVVVYCRSHYFKVQPSEYKGSHLVYLKAVHAKSFETLLHTLVSVLHVIVFNTADTILVMNVGNAPAALIAKLLRKKVIFCVDGLDWERRKWGRLARWYLRMCSYVAKYVAHKVVTDAGSVMEFYRAERNTQSVMIPYGTDFDTGAYDKDVLAEYGLQSKKYFLFMSRFEPEYNPLMVVRAYAASGCTLPLVMVGDNRYDQTLVNAIKRAARGNVIFTGYVFGSKYKTLMREALCYIRAAEVGGFSPAVVEAMGRATCVVAADRSENREPLADTGMYFDLNETSLSAALQSVEANPERAIMLGKQSAQRAMLLYSWDTIGYEYYQLIKELAMGATTKADAAPAHTVSEHKKTILITGSAGMLGRAVYQQLRGSYNIVATNRTAYENWLTKMDVTDYVAFEKMVATIRPDYIFHFAAYTNLEWCEKHLPETYTVNTLTVKHAAQLATKYGAKLVYASTSGVFDGNKVAYRETDEAQPLTVYGLTKHMGALMAEYYATDYLIIRPSWLMGGGAHTDKKFVGKIVQQIVSGERSIHAIDNMFGTLTYAADVARVIEKLLQKDATGLYNVAGIGRASRYDIAREVVRILGYDDTITITPVNETYFKNTYFTHRSPSESLINERLESEHIHLMRPWPEALREYMERDYAYAFNKKPRLREQLLPQTV